MEKNFIVRAWEGLKTDVRRGGGIAIGVFHRHTYYRDVILVTSSA